MFAVTTVLPKVTVSCCIISYKYLYHCSVNGKNMNEVIDEVFGCLYTHVSNIFVPEVFVHTSEYKRSKEKTENS